MKYLNVLMVLILIIVGGCMKSCVGCSDDDEEVSSLNAPFGGDDGEYDDEEWDEDDGGLFGSSVVSVPFRECGSLKYIQVLINDRIKKEMIFDTGASYTQITLNEANYLFNEGVLTADDILGTERFGDANGDITVNMVVNLRRLDLGDELTVTNVKATVVENADAPLLLGQSVLKELPQYTIDNEKKVIKFKIK